MGKLACTHALSVESAGCEARSAERPADDIRGDCCRREASGNNDRLHARGLFPVAVKAAVMSGKISLNDQLTVLSFSDESMNSRNKIIED